MDSAKKLNITQENIYINIGKNKIQIRSKIRSKMCNKIKCAIQYTLDLINNKINRDVQEECANSLYRVYTHSSNTDVENNALS